MNADEFLETARRLAAGTTEGDWRSAVSRAYYAVFHFFREWLEANGTTLGSKDKVHRNLCEGLIYCGVAEVKPIGQEVDHLCAQRNAADYTFTRPVTQRDALLAVQRADQILADFKAITAVPPGTVADGVRDFSSAPNDCLRPRPDRVHTISPPPRTALTRAQDV